MSFNTIYVLLMSVRMAPRLPLIVLLMIHGVSGADWGVSYSHSHICALKNSSVIMSCTYTYPTGYKIKKVFWTKGPVKGVEPPDLSEDPEYSQRLQYLGDKQQNCTIRLSHVTQKDAHMYYFRFITNVTDGVWLGKPGVTLTVTDLQVEAPERVTEGDSVRLTCKSSCALTDGATFIWYRNSQPLTERRDRNNQLLLQSVRREDAGRYSCALHGHTYISPAVQLSVTYPPKSISVSISPSGEIVEGDSVTLICSSESNPPAEISWFKGGTFVGSGRIYSISKISSDHSGEYKCKSRNEHGEKYSDAVTLNIMSVRCFSSVAAVAAAVAVGVLLGGASGASVMYICLNKRMNRRSAMKESVISDPIEDTYTALELKSMTSDLYDTLTTVHPRPPGDSCTTLDPKHENPSINRKMLQ
ncbi:carcinoembryonic antigen-related cell adhesion molecule 6-like isoform X2 [Onychostoma macrolepis]|uniref:carcinoembryonic antigen-related cell adhesion molecule 6-like isoform X2 n=1 Tax=Onychostoma macrolepis TaxID=369639 RepID=UPI00272A78A8|nr:carcinoembryonic antigen-related cell adhesion molecule 6-like isoform X2 [Onychostoma macrolepis]